MSVKVLKLRQQKVYVKVIRKDGSEEPYLLLHTKTGIYYVRKFKAGRGELFKSTGQTQISRARTVRDQLITAFEGGETLIGRKRFAAVCDELLVELEKEHLILNEYGKPQRSVETIQKDRQMLRAPLPEKKIKEGGVRKLFGGNFVDQLDEEFWKNWQRNEGRALNRTLFDIGKYVSKVLTFAHARKYVMRKPVIEIPKLETKRHQIYQDKHIRLFIKHAEPLLKDLIMAEAPTGARPHEIRELRWEWISFYKGRVVVTLPPWFTKVRGDGREFQASPMLEKVLRRRYRERDRLSPFVFPSPKNPQKPVNKKHLSKMWRRMLKAAGLEPGTLKFHWLRHTFYNRALFEAREPIQHVSEYGGTSIATLQKNYFKSDSLRTASVSKAVNIDFTKKDEEE
jgi:integrase